MSIVRTLWGVAGAVLAVAALAAPAVAQDTPAPPPTGVKPMIIDGQPAKDAPWAARQFNDGKEACSATIISPEWVLTAQHCVAKANQISFHIGSLDQTQGEEAKAKPGGVHIHDKADFALVNIDHPVQVPQYSPLASSPDVVKVGDTVQTYGWGATCTDKPEIECQSQVLKVADVTVTDVNCQDYRQSPAICAKRGDGIPAGGDSGGPMFGKGSDGKVVQIGVASTSDRQENTAYGSVAAAREWIKSVAGV